MDPLLDRFKVREGGPVLRSNGTALVEIERRLMAGAPPERIGSDLNLEALDVVAALAALGLGRDGDDGPPLVQQAPPRPDLRAALEEPALARLVPEATRPTRLALAAGLLQIHDFWDPSHQAAQEADDLGERSYSAFWHGIGHRREPDPGNAAYWFRRVGSHPIFAPLARHAAALLGAQSDPTPEAERLIRGGAWDPFAFIDLCRSARPGSPAEGLARRLQRLEMNILIGATAEATLTRGSG